MMVTREMGVALAAMRAMVLGAGEGESGCRETRLWFVVPPTPQLSRELRTSSPKMRSTKRRPAGSTKACHAKMRNEITVSFRLHFPPASGYKFMLIPQPAPDPISFAPNRAPRSGQGPGVGRGVGDLDSIAT